MPADAKLHVAHPGGYMQCCTYLIEGPDGTVLVDPGSGSAEWPLTTSIEWLAGGVERVRAILITHCHYDHARGAYRFRERGIPVICTPWTAQVLRAGGPEVWPEYPDYVIPTEVDVTPADGDVLELAGVAIRVVHTPGHTAGCASYMVDTEKGRAVFTGDLLGPNGHPGWAGSETFSAEDTLASVEKLLTLEPALGFTGHRVVNEPAGDWLRRAANLGRGGAWELKTDLHPENAPLPPFQRREG